MLRVKCHLLDCAYHHKPKTASEPGMCDCAHPDKEMYLGPSSCPLYKKDWLKMTNAEDIKGRFARRRV